MIPLKILSNVGDLRHLDVSHNGITKVDEDALAAVRNLHFLNISFNNIREFEPRTFAGLSRDAIQCCRDIHQLFRAPSIKYVLKNHPYCKLDNLLTKTRMYLG